MDMLLMIAIGGLLTSASTMMFLHKFDIKKVLYFDLVLDALFDVVIPMLFIGTLTGMMIAIVAGITNSIYLHYLKHKIGYKRPGFSLRHGLTWIEVLPKNHNIRGDYVHA